MWQPVTNHEAAWEYLQAGLLWYGVPPDDMSNYRVAYYNPARHTFLSLCDKMGGVGGFNHPHYILVEE